MKKYLLFYFFISSLFIMNRAAYADILSGLVAGGRGWNYTAIAAASGTVATGSGEFGGFYLSSGSHASVDWAIALDTVVAASIAYSTFESGQRVTPAVMFESSATITSGDVAASTAQPRRGNYEKTFDITDAAGVGIRFINGLFFFKTSGSSGEAVRGVVKWRR